MALWPDQEAAYASCAGWRVPAGGVLIAWHGGTRPSRIARGLALSDDNLARIERGLGGFFSSVARHELATLTVFAAVR